ncbi:hypothetical protein Y032_0562g3490 [Ancylostoma ceylanicum]|uniref:Uncharacterized protein n=1 Tax=Ancylostoma ceylanicum TaxID=53326 RepID=A0A016WPV3_9BILA|nr:hypothetical protein Y032_0562g3490 [Ancylostoma ceylanicum]
MGCECNCTDRKVKYIYCTNSAKARAGAMGRRSLARRMTPCFFCTGTKGCFIGGAIRHCTYGACELCRRNWKEWIKVQ